MEERITTITKELKQDLFAAGQPTRIMKNIGDECNSFCFKPEKLAEEIMKDKEILDHFMILASACSVAIGYEEACDRKRSTCWCDERKKASKEYCYKHMDAFKQVFKSLTGKELPFKENPGYQYFLQDCKLEYHPDFRYSALTSEVCDFLKEHPTLQQRMIGLFVTVIAKTGRYPEIDEDTRFPFI